MAFAFPGDDDDLLDELRAALRAGAATSARAADAGRAAWTWRVVDEELAELTRDSWGGVGAAADALTRDGGGHDDGRRTLTFEGSTGSVELQIDGDRVVGQFLPPAVGRVQLFTADGPGAAGAADELGCFTLDLPDRGPWRLRCTREPDALLTTWIDR